MAIRIIVVGVFCTVLCMETVYSHRLQRFIAHHGGAHGSYGTSLVHKREAARYLAQKTNFGYVYHPNNVYQIDRAITREGHNILIAERVQPDIVYLAGLYQEQVPVSGHGAVIIIDQNRANFKAQRWTAFDIVTNVPDGEKRQKFALNSNKATEQMQFGPLWVIIATGP